MKFVILFLLVFFFFLSNNSQIKCKYNYFQKYKEIYDNISEINLLPGTIQSNFITFDKPKYLIYNNNSNYNDLLIHLYSINCQIEVDIDNNLGNATIINPSENDAYLIKVKNPNIRIKLALNKKYEINYNRKCMFVINSMFDNNFELKVEENDPAIFYFDNNFNSIRLSYDLNNFKNINFVLFSFIFNEKASFEIVIEENIEINKIRKISNSQNIFLNLLYLI